MAHSIAPHNQSVMLVVNKRSAKAAVAVPMVQSGAGLK